jgi:HD-GYP domain-containing protein (c-di-GMP phosphodiesterase class II)
VFRHVSGEKLERVFEIGQDIARIKDLDVLLERILTEARRLTGADAGSIYLREADTLTFSHTQNDTIEGTLPPGKKMIYSTFTMPLTNRSIAGHVAATGTILNIADAYSLPPGVPYSFDKRFDSISGYRTRSMLVFPIRPHGGETAGVLQLINAMSPGGDIVSFSREDEPFVLHFAATAATALERAGMTRAIILRMIGMARLRDPKETGAHVNRVASYAMEVYESWARRRGYAPERIERDRDSLRMGAMLHDVGKIAIPDAILKKPARLTADERRVMKAHTWLGARLFGDRFSDFDEASYVIALTHHEKWDGTGYPGHVDPLAGKPLPGHEGPEGEARGKRGEEIHPFGRAVAVADVYDALMSARSYKEAWKEEQVLETIRADSGTHFDPDMVDALFSSLDIIRSLAGRYPD